MTAECHVIGHRPAVTHDFVDVVEAGNGDSADAIDRETSALNRTLTDGIIGHYEEICELGRKRHSGSFLGSAEREPHAGDGAANRGVSRRCGNAGAR